MKPRSSTKPTTIAAYIAQVDEGRRDDLQRLHEMIRKEVPELTPTMAFAMPGYGRFHHKYASGREAEWFRIGLANRKQYISLYCCAVADGAYVAEQFRDRLPKANIGKSCVRFKRLSDLDEGALRELIRATAKGSFGM